MCGRTACALAPNQLCKACSGNADRKYKGDAKWRDVPGNVDSYKPRFNLAPNVYNPILLSGHHFVRSESKESDTESTKSGDNNSDDDEISSDDLIIQPMRWGLLPSYHKGETKFNYATINARAENVMERLTYRVPLSKGRRCVVLADGFYEWKRSQQAKQPYLIYFPQKKSIKWDHPEEEDGDEQWTGRRLLTMAGIFEINRTGEHPLFTYSIITVAASKNLEWMHDRMPALLDGDEAVDKWLDSENVPLEEALTLLKPVDNVAYHPVAVGMGNVRLQGPECIVPLEEKKVYHIPAQKHSNLITQYFKPQLQKANVKSENDESSEENGGGPAPKTPKKT